MHWLLNARLLGGMALVAALAFSHMFAYRTGRAVVRAQWDKDIAVRTQAALAAEQAARHREQDLVIARNRSEERYAQEKRKAASSASSANSELGRLRDQLAARNSASPQDSAANARANGAAGLERELLGHCAAALVGLAAEADRLEATVVGLQSYVKDVCQKP